MLSIAELTDRASALSSPKKLTSSASFSPSIRISLRLKIHQAQAKNFCRVLDIRVTKIMESDMWQVICLENSGEVCSHETRLDDFTNLIDIDVIKVILTITAATQPLIFFLFPFHFQ